MHSLTSPQKSVSPSIKKINARKFDRNARDEKSLSLPGHKGRVVENNYLGKKIDKMTELARKPDALDKTSIYAQDYQAQGLNQSLQHAPQSDSLSKQAHPQGNYDAVSTSTANNLKSPNGANQIANQTNLKNETTLNQTKQDSLDAFQQSQESEKKFRSDNWKPRFEVDLKRTNISTLNFQGNKTSLYQRDFVPYDPKNQVPINKPDLWNTHRSQFPMEAKTINKQDYIDWKMPAPERGKDPFRLLTLDIPLNTGTSYRTQYVNWGPNAARLLMPAKPGTVISDLPFDDRTVYKGDFGGSKKEMAPSLDVSLLPTAKKESVMSSSIPFLGQTCYSKSFQPFKIVASELIAQRKHVQDGIVPNASYAGNFTTMKNRDFANPLTKVYVDE